MSTLEGGKIMHIVQTPLQQRLLLGLWECTFELEAANYSNTHIYGFSNAQ